jgi:uncharacterized protein (DUF302 family)
MSYFLSKEFHKPFSDVVERLKQSLEAQGYVIAIDIDVTSALKNRIGAEVAETRIIGTNKPEVGQQMFSTDPRMGTLLPFSIVIHTLANGTVEVAMVDPEKLLGLVQLPEITSLAEDIKNTFVEVLNSL